MSQSDSPGVRDVVVHWLLGTALISWRYLWDTTPLHRTEREGDEAEDAPPPLPAELVDAAVQTPDEGYGPMFHRRFRVRIAEARLGPEQLMAKVADDFQHFVPSEVVDVHGGQAGDAGLRVGDDPVVKMPGPWNGPVRVVHRDATSLGYATLRGHFEAGQAQFRAYRHEDLLIFEIEVWARPSTRLIHLLYSRLRVAKEVQLNMWVRFCLAAASTAGGRPADGVHICTRRAPFQRS
ncbi:MAG TPA: DUF1990 family protein [Nocardioidaceae bacterium]|nr:DUF1990 family protein [Nocardioidaceae bacterium]